LQLLSVGRIEADRDDNPKCSGYSRQLLINKRYSQVSVSWQIQNVPIVGNPASKKLYQHRARNKRGKRRRGTTWLTVTTAATFTEYSPSMCLAAADPNSLLRVESDFGDGLRPSPKSLRGDRRSTKQSFDATIISKRLHRFARNDVAFVKTFEGLWPLEPRIVLPQFS